MKIMQQHYHSTIYCKIKGISEKKVDYVFIVLRLERGGEQVIWASRIKMVISQLLYKI